MKIALAGAYPDFGGAIGGVSIHIKRMRAHLLGRQHQVKVFATAGRGLTSQDIWPVSTGWLLPCHALANSRWLFHLHYTSPGAWVGVAGASLLRKAKTVLTLHGERLNWAWSSASRARRVVLRSALRRYDHVLAVNDRVAATAAEVLGSQERLSMIPAFVPPVECQADRDALPAAMWSFMRAHRPVLSMNGAINLYQGQDLYGFDLMLRALQSLVKEHPDMGVVAAIAGVAAGAEDLWRKTRQLAEELNVQEHVYWHRDGGEFYPILQDSDLMLRPTRTDGWPLSIGEAMYFGVPVVASDAAPRPSGTSLFATGDAQALAAGIHARLAGPRRDQPITFDFHEQLINLYTRLSQ
jgi:glycosyltransferase involved in cell wall biosynthesis